MHVRGAGGCGGGGGDGEERSDGWGDVRRVAVAVCARRCAGFGHSPPLTSTYLTPHRSSPTPPALSPTSPTPPHISATPPHISPTTTPHPPPVLSKMAVDPRIRDRLAKRNVRPDPPNDANWPALDLFIECVCERGQVATGAGGQPGAVAVGPTSSYRERVRAVGAAMGAVWRAWDDARRLGAGAGVAVGPMDAHAFGGVGGAMAAAVEAAYQCAGHVPTGTALFVAVKARGVDGVVGGCMGVVHACGDWCIAYLIVTLTCICTATVTNTTLTLTHTLTPLAPPAVCLPSCAWRGALSVPGASLAGAMGRGGGVPGVAAVRGGARGGGDEGRDDEQGGGEGWSGVGVDVRGGTMNRVEVRRWVG